jgi:hypothetical protein
VTRARDRRLDDRCLRPLDREEERPGDLEALHRVPLLRARGPRRLSVDREKRRRIVMEEERAGDEVGGRELRPVILLVDRVVRLAVLPARVGVPLRPGMSALPERTKPPKKPTGRTARSSGAGGSRAARRTASIATVPRQATPDPSILSP